MILKGLVDICGNTIERNINLIFDTSEYINPKYFKVNNQIDSLNYTHFETYKDQLYETINEKNIPIAKAKLIFYKDNKIVEKTQTDLNGYFNIYLKDGEYDLLIQNSRYKNKIKYEITNGLNNQSYFTAVSNIKKRIGSTILLNNIDIPLIKGNIVDENNKIPQDIDLIISKDDKLFVYIKPDKYGKFNFLLDYGIYDIRLRSDKYGLKIYKNFVFNENTDFIDSLNSQTNLFKRGEIIWRK